MWGRNMRILCLTLAAALLSTMIRSPLAADRTARSWAPDFYSDNAQLEAFVRQALGANPGLQESMARYRAALQQVAQATALPDPMLNYNQFLRSVETRVGPQLTSVVLSQKFPWFGELDVRGQAVLKEAAALYQAYRARQREIINLVKQAYYELSYLDRAIAINEEERLLLAHYERLAQSRFAAGQGLQQAVIKIQAELTRTLDRLKVLRRQRETGAAQLNTLMDQPPERPLGRVPELDLPRANLELPGLYELGEKNRPELKASFARVEKNEKAIQLAKKDFWPDFTIGAGFTNVGDRGDLPGVLMPPPDNGKNAFSFSIGVNIPIWRDKYRAGVLEATESLIAERKNYLNLRNEMEFSIRDQTLRLETLLEQIDLFERVLIPQAEESLRSTESAYETGQVGSLDLLDGERFLLDVKLVRVRYRADYLKALSALERAVGTRFP